MSHVSSSAEGWLLFPQKFFILLFSNSFPPDYRPFSFVSPLVIISLDSLPSLSLSSLLMTHAHFSLPSPLSSATSFLHGRNQLPPGVSSRKIFFLESPGFPHQDGERRLLAESASNFNPCCTRVLHPLLPNVQ